MSDFATVLVTGGAGFIGSNYVRSLLARERQVQVINLDLLTYAGSLANLDNLPDPARHTFVQGDITDASLVLRLLTEHQVDAIVHFAAESHVDRSISGAAPFINTNILGTFTLLEAAREAWKERGEACRFVHVSTDEVYGTLAPSAPPFCETTAYAPNSPYSASKASADHLVRAYYETYKLPTVTTNCSNNYGPYQYPEKLIPLMIINALTGKNLPVYGDGLQVRDWLYVDDHCEAIHQVLKRGRLGQTYNIGGLCERTNIQIVRTICDILDELRPQGGGRGYREQITHVQDRPGHDRRYAIDARKIMGELGWAPRECFESAIRRTITWYLDNQDWVNALMSDKYDDWIAVNYAGRRAFQ